MKISARNFIHGKIIEVQKGATTSHISIEISGCVLTASITNESVEELKLEKGKEASAIIKSSDVMIAID
jgi:molybdopterin-binding protein